MISPIDFWMSDLRELEDEGVESIKYTLCDLLSILSQIKAHARGDDAPFTMRSHPIRVAKILQFPNGNIVDAQSARSEFESCTGVDDAHTTPLRNSSTLVDVLKCFEDPSHSFETIKIVYKRISRNFRQRQREEKKGQWTS